MYPFGVGSNGGSRPTERSGSVFSVAGICVVSVGAIASLYASIPQECKIASSALQFTLDVALPISDSVGPSRETERQGAASSSLLTDAVSPRVARARQ
jgi:hypothetical protein